MTSYEMRYTESKIFWDQKLDEKENLSLVAVVVCKCERRIPWKPQRAMPEGKHLYEDIKLQRTKEHFGTREVTTTFIEH